MHQSGWTPTRPAPAWSGEGLTLDPERFTQVQRLARQAQLTEPAITELVERAVTDTPAQLVKTDSRLKTLDSIARKVAADLANQRPGARARTGFERLDDLVRYTVVVNDDAFTATTLQIMSTMRTMTGEPTRIANTFLQPGYKAVHAYWQRPNGVQFEIQFHTPATLERARATRTDYEQGRIPGQTSKVRRRSRGATERAFSDVTPPPGVDAIRPKSRTTGQAANKYTQAPSRSRRKNQEITR